MTSLNHALFGLLNASAAPPDQLLAFAIICAKYLYYLVPLHMALVWYAGPRELRYVALVGLLALAATLLLSGLIGLAYPTSRPFVLGIGHTLLAHRPSAAFPSNHTIVCMSWAATLGLFGYWRLAFAMAGLGLMVGWSRVYLGVHFPLDIVGGAALAVAGSFGCVWLIMRDEGRTIMRLDRLGDRLAPFRSLRGAP